MVVPLAVWFADCCSMVLTVLSDECEHSEPFRLGEEIFGIKIPVTRDQRDAHTFRFPNREF